MIFCSRFGGYMQSLPERCVLPRFSGLDAVRPIEKMGREGKRRGTQNAFFTALIVAGTVRGGYIGDLFCMCQYVQKRRSFIRRKQPSDDMDNKKIWGYMIFAAVFFGGGCIYEGATYEGSYTRLYSNP